MIFVFGKLNEKAHTPHDTNTMLYAVQIQLFPIIKKLFALRITLHGLTKFLFTDYKRQIMHSEIDYIHIEIKKGAVASFTKTPTAETLAMVRKLVERWEEKVNKNLVKPDVIKSVCCNSDLVNFNTEYNQCFVCEKIYKKKQTVL